jgi:hypothetical protein
MNQYCSIREILLRVPHDYSDMEAPTVGIGRERTSPINMPSDVLETFTLDANDVRPKDATGVGPEDATGVGPEDVNGIGPDKVVGVDLLEDPTVVSALAHRSVGERRVCS